MSWKVFLASMAAALATIAGACEVFFENYYIEIHSYDYFDDCDEGPKQ